MKDDGRPNKIWLGGVYDSQKQCVVDGAIEVYENGVWRCTVKSVGKKVCHMSQKYR